MGKRPLAKMPIKDRAKQFMPFAALKGFEEAIRFSEKLVQNKGEINRNIRKDK